MSQSRNQSPLALWAAGTNWGCHIRGCQWGITVVSKQLKKCYLVSKQLKNRHLVSKQQKNVQLICKIILSPADGYGRL